MSNGVITLKITEEQAILLAELVGECVSFDDYDKHISEPLLKIIEIELEYAKLFKDVRS